MNECWNNYDFFFWGSRDRKFIMFSYSEVGFGENACSLLIQRKILSKAFVFNLELVEVTKAKRPNEIIFRKLSA